MNKNTLRKSISINTVHPLPFSTKVEPQSLKFTDRTTPFLYGRNLEDQKNVTTLSRIEMINKLNQSHFLGSSVIIFIKKNLNWKMIAFANIKTISDNIVTGSWISKSEIKTKNMVFPILYIGIDDGRTLAFVPVLNCVLKENFISGQIEETGWEVNHRKTRRYVCRRIKVNLSQENINIRGYLVDFSSNGLRARVKSEFNDSIRNFKLHQPISIIFSDQKNYSFLTNCHLLYYQKLDTKAIDIIVKPLGNPVSNLPQSTVTRPPRLHLSPVLMLFIKHPFINKFFQFEIDNISVSGVCILVSANENVLIRDMLISSAEIQFPDGKKIKCQLKVVYSVLQNEGVAKLGLSITEITNQEYNKLFGVILRAFDDHAFFNQKIDLHSLWQLFFENNFIYQKKYEHIRLIRKKLHKTYEKIYLHQHGISNHITYQKLGSLYGHIAMIRAYEKTWLVHHYVAKIVDNKPIGLILLKHIIHYFLGIYRLRSNDSEYIMIYFRTENRFPSRVFGGFHRNTSNNQICSIDFFSYVKFPTISLLSKIPDHWSFNPSTSVDWERMNDFYRKFSGGLFIDSLGIFKPGNSFEKIKEYFSRFKFMREIKAYSVFCNNEICALIIIERSESGMNLADLLNHIKIIIIKPEPILWKILSRVLLILKKELKLDQMPILIYPTEYVKILKINFEKEYQQCILRVDQFSIFAEYIQKKYRMGFRQ